MRTSTLLKCLLMEWEGMGRAWSKLSINIYSINKSGDYSRRPASNQGDRTDLLERTGGSSGGGVWVAALLTHFDPTLSPDRPPDLQPGAYGREAAESWGPRVLEGLRP